MGSMPVPLMYGKNSCAVFYCYVAGSWCVVAASRRRTLVQL